MSQGEAEMLSISALYLFAGFIYMIPSWVAFRR